MSGSSVLVSERRCVMRARRMRAPPSGRQRWTLDCRSLLMCCKRCSRASAFLKANLKDEPRGTSEERAGGWRANRPASDHGRLHLRATTPPTSRATVSSPRDQVHTRRASREPSGEHPGNQQGTARGRGHTAQARPAAACPAGPAGSSPAAGSPAGLSAPS